MSQPVRIGFTNPLQDPGDGRSRNIKGSIMTISSVSTPPPASAPVVADTAPSSTKTSSATPGDTNSWQPPAKSPLPPGQGTRIDQLV
ncbi:MAG: hypothetical protein JSS22_13240 [Proteobacteria bacterium]|nr:hypothetical protein [Pseudomonadota bacterium]